MDYLGLDIKTDEGVYEPAEDSFLAAGIVEAEVQALGWDLDVLDLGCGTGLLGLVAAKSGNVRRVLFADINERAVELCKDNIESNSGVIHAECTAIKSNLFSRIREKFNLIIFNAPYLPDNDKTELSESWYGGKGGVELSVKFLNDAVSRLKENGRILIVESSFGDIGSLKKKMDLIGLEIESERSVHISFEDIIGMVLRKKSGAKP